MPLTEADRVFMRELGLRSFFHFVKMFGLPVKQGADISAVTHRALCDFAQDDSIKRKGISLGRNLRKTTTFTRWMSIWRYLRDNEERILICAQSLDIARGSIGWIKKQLTQNTLLRWAYPELQQINDNYANSKKHAFSDTEVELPRQGIYAEPTYRALGAGSALQGRHFTCLLPGTPVITSKGVRPIESIDTHNRVLSHTGYFQIVTDTLAQEYSGKVIRVKPKGWYGTYTMTADHPVMVMRPGQYGRNIEFARAEDIRASDMLVFPRFQRGGKYKTVFNPCTEKYAESEKMLADDDFFRFLGYWTAEGARSVDPHDTRVRLTFGSTEMDYCLDCQEILARYGIKATINKTGPSGLVVSCHSRTLRHLLRKIGDYCYDKRLPYFIYKTTDKKTLEFLKGYLRGDGHFGKNNIIASTTSFDLAIGVHLLLNRLGISAAIKYLDPKEWVNKFGKTVHARASWTTHIPNCLNFLFDNNVHHNYKFIFESKHHYCDKDYWYYSIESLTSSDYTGPVYNLEVDKDHTYCSPYMTSHNCIHLTDIINEKTLASPILLEKAQLWVDNLQELLVEPDWRSPTGSTIQVDASLWATGDTYDYMMTAHPEYQWVIAPALKMSDADIERAKAGRSNVMFIQSPDVGVMESNFADVVGDDGRSIFPTEMYLAMMADPQVERIFWAQHQNVPSFGASQTNPFKHDWLRWYDLKAGQDGKSWVIVCHDPQGDVEVPFTRFTWWGIIDFGGFSEHSIKGSRCAAIIAGQDRESARKVVLWAWAKRVIKPKELMDVIYAANDKWKPRGWRCEVYAQQRYIKRDLQEEQERRGTRLSIGELPMETGANAKEMRIDGLRAPAANGELYLHASQHDLKAEYLGYPNALSNDLIDCLAWFNQMFGTGLDRKKHGADANQRYREYLGSKSSVTGY